MEVLKKPKEQKDENKPKSVIINGALHARFKKYCDGTNLKIGRVIEDLISLYLSDPKEIQKLVDKVKNK